MQKLLTLGMVALIVLGLTSGVSAQGPGLEGTWEMTTVSPQGTTMNTMVISKEGEALKAVAKSERGERQYDTVQLDGTKVTIVLTIDFQGSPMVITYTGRIDKDKMEGDADFGGLAQGTWSAARK